jgi:cyclopropane fatty-acyl-phospholipid synthase-like methyltransferase
MSLPQHLGGHKNKTHLDEGALELAIKKFGVKTMLDIGCGPAGMVELACSMGIDAQGIDGDFEVERPNVPVTIHDYEKGPGPLGNLTVDLIWSCEFVEHVYEEFLSNFMQDFQRGRVVFMTFAPPNTPGHHHVNCNTKEYWIDVFDQYGFDYDDTLTNTLRDVSTMGRWKKNKETGERFWWKAFVRENGLAFIKR